SRRRHTRFSRDWSSDVCSSDLGRLLGFLLVGTIFVLIFARAARTVASALDADPLAGMGLGLLWLLFVPVAIFAAFVTVIGIPLRSEERRVGNEARTQSRTGLQE